MPVGLGADRAGADGEVAPVAKIDVPTMGVVELLRHAGQSRIALFVPDAGDGPSAP